MIRTTVILLLAVLPLGACLGNVKYPTLFDPTSMSDETLCYRQAYAQHREEINAEIEARRLDCRAMMSDSGMEQRGY